MTNWYSLVITVLVLFSNLFAIIPFFKEADAATVFSISTTASNQPVISRESNYQIADYENGTHATTLGLPMWAFDSKNNIWAPIVINNLGNGTISIQSGLIAVKFVNGSATLLDSNMTRTLTAVKETWQLYNSALPVNSTFKSISINQAGNNANVSQTFSTLAGTLTVMYIFREGQPLKHEVWFSTLIPGMYSVLQNWNIPLDSYRLANGALVSVTSISNTTQVMTKAQLGSQTMVAFYKNGLPILYESLQSAWSNFNSMAIRKAGSQTTASFSYGNWTGSFQLDPNTAILQPSSSENDQTTTGTGAGCPGSPYGDNTIDNTLAIVASLPISTNTASCFRSDVRVTTLGIPSTALVSSVKLGLQVNSVTNGQNCNYMPMVQSGSDPVVLSQSQLWTEIGDGTPYISNSNTCTTTGPKQITLGSQANTDLMNELSAGWFAVGIMFSSETRDSSLHQVKVDFTSANTNITVTYTPAVTVRIQLNPGSGTLTPFSSNFVVSCNLQGISTNNNHNGNPATQSFTCDATTSVTVATPTDGANSRYRFGDGTTSKSFTSCSSGTCSTQSYIVYGQFAVTITLSGLDSSKSLPITRTQLGSLAGQSVSGSTATVVWSDQNQNVVTPATDTISTTERFQSYNTTSSLTYNATSSASKTYLYNHEYYVWLLVHEKHLGILFSPMPQTSWTGTVISSNGTRSPTITFNVQQSDDLVQPATQYWMRNGTLTLPSDLTWRGLVVNNTGTQTTITNANNVTIESTSIHYGINTGNHHIRAGVDQATSRLTVNKYDSNAATFNFTATATSGLHTAKVEFIATDYSGVSLVTVNGVTVPTANYTVTQDTSISPVANILTINNLHFSTDTIFIQFIAASSQGGQPSGMGGGGAVNPYPNLPPLSTVPAPTGGLLNINVLTTSVSATPATTQTFNVLVNWTGANQITITSITFGKSPVSFVLGTPLPYTTNSMSTIPYSNSQTNIPIVLTVPSNMAAPSTLVVPMTLVGSAGGSGATVTVPISVSLISSGLSLPLVFGIGLVLALVAVGIERVVRYEWF